MMLGLAGRRAALARAPVPAAVPLRRAPADACSPSPSHCRGFRSTPAQAAFRPAWMPMRVKTPWIEALTRSRDADGTARDGGTPRAQPDLKPKRISDSSYTAVCYYYSRLHENDGGWGVPNADQSFSRFYRWRRTSGFWIPISTPPGTSGIIIFPSLAPSPRPLSTVRR